jgi:alcohol dehydrogenase class IV
MSSGWIVADPSTTRPRFAETEFCPEMAVIDPELPVSVASTRQRCKTESGTSLETESE